jgi:hypothetical protein
MDERASPGIDTDDPAGFAAALGRERTVRRLEASREEIDTGLARLVLGLIEFLRKVLEHQAVGRMEGGRLTDEEIERLGLALMRLEQRLEELKSEFGLEGESLDIDLGPLGRLS